MGIFGTFTLMRRAMGWFGLVFMIWAMAGMGIHFFWNSTSAKRSLAERVAAGEALERWVLTESEYAELGVVDGEFWLEDRVYDVMNTERLEGGLVALQVFDDSYETDLAKWGRKLLKRTVGDTHVPPAGLELWLSLHAVVPPATSTNIAWIQMDQPQICGEVPLKEARWRSGVLHPPEGVA